MFALSRPLAVFDLETTGPQVGIDRVVQFAVVKLMPDGTRKRWDTLIHPGCRIPARATAIHGVTDEMVAASPGMSVVGPLILAGLQGCDLGGYNARRFDVPFLEADMRRAGVSCDLHSMVVVDPLRIFQHFSPRDLNAACVHYLGRDIAADAHDAKVDAEAALDVLLAQIERHQVADWTSLVGLSAGGAIDLEGKLVWDGEEACFAFGKHRGQTLRWVAQNDASFLDWMLQADFPSDVKTIVWAAATSGRFPERRAP